MERRKKSLIVAMAIETKKIRNEMERLIKAHRFFVKESPLFMKGTSRVRYYLYYPIAYLKFMYYTFKSSQP